MSDCPNGEVRDSLPDLVNGRLDGIALAAVRTHVAGCAECQAEVALIEGARAAIVASTPRVDTERIIRSLGTKAARPTYRQWSEWRIAAAILVVAMGGAVGLYSRSEVVTSRRVHDSLAIASASAVPAQVADTSAELSVSGDVNRLTDDQLRELLDKIGTMDALPSVESRRVSIPIGSAVTPDGADSADPKGAM
jgi:anti-sigma factor RsiW